MITNFKIYDIDETTFASGFPKSTESIPEFEKKEEYSNELLSQNFRVKKLGEAKAGSGHDCFLKGIVCNMNINGSLKWWAQFQRYHFADIVSSQSTMHCIIAFDIRKMCNEWVDDIIIKRLEFFVDNYNNSKSFSDKEYWFNTIIYNIPTGFCLTARVTTNLLQLKTIYQQRNNHKLYEWKVFIFELRELIPEFLTRIIFK